MNIDELKERARLIVPRAKNLWQIYPLLTITVLLIGSLIGFLLGKWL